MKIIAASLFFLVCFFPGSLFSQSKLDVLHYRFEVSLSDSSDRINGNAVIKLKALEPLSSVEFDLANLNEKTGKGMVVSKVSSNKKQLSYTHKDNRITLQPATALKAGEETAIEIVYQGIPSDGLIISKNKYGHRTFFADNWPNRGHNWMPCVDEPADKASVEFIVKAPQSYQVVANGVQVESYSLPGDRKLTHWKEDVPLPTKIMVIGVADFAVNLSGMVNGCIPVTSWVYPQDREKGFYDFALAAEILPWFIDYIGPYGYKKLANVQSKTTFGGLENANTIFYAESAVSGDRSHEDLLAHEIAHQWFGDMVTEKKFAHLWLSEGFATYMTIRYMEQKYGLEKATDMLKQDRREIIAFARESKRPVVDEESSYMELLNANSYQKGGWILHMLRRQLGDSIFHKSIRSYYAAYAGKNADTRDLQRIFEKESGKDLSTFFDQWLYRPGLPLLEMRWSYSAEKQQTTLFIKQRQGNIFQFPLEFGWQSSTGKKGTHTIEVTKAEEEFILPVKEKIVKLSADPHTSLLFEGTLSEKR